MTTAKEIMGEVEQILETKWSLRKGTVVPAAEGVKLGNDAVELDATVLYADLVDSTALVSSYKAHFAAEIYKSYLVGALRIITNNGGEITAFDGDRIMSVFIGESKNSNAGKTALQINWLVGKVINPAIQKQYPNTSYKAKQVVGIDTSSLFVAKTGVRGTNDLVWVGRAANHAAKLSDLREGGFSSLVTEDVFKRFKDNIKLGGDPKRSMWEKLTWKEKGSVIYGSNWSWAV